MKQITDKDVAIIILNWNAYDDTFECLKSLEHLTYPYFHVFLVDNASQDNSFDKLQEDYKEGKFNVPITFIQTGANLGFAGGNNVAIKEAYNQGYQYFWMLNNDTVVDPNALTPLVEALEKDKQVGIVGSKIYYYGTNKIWFAGGKVNTWTGATKHIGIKEEDIGQYDRQSEVDYITGCSLCFRKEVIENVGYMFEDYFLYYEETDWNIRARQNNWSIKFVPDSIVFHKISASSGGEENPAPYVGYYDIRNSLVFIKRTQPDYKIVVAFLYSIWKVIKKIVRMIVTDQDSKKRRLLFLIRGLIDGSTNKMGHI
ncbi:glycosyltransferase family 2 protein [Anoxybacillus flavithermus]|uniref:glycosyltransferase family 2 protein n=1 Tax=Anoxybacillus flavithermus TaxID=33934 RepID=UPI001866DCA8|nr:glycosyltransferase family 2 protein [Anoxybacillus flavithermus]MBE2904513.1 glycosyltransferase family 2 protein [Anoxybacillus flavithermus]